VAKLCTNSCVPLHFYFAINIPNGLLSDKFGNSLIQAGKNKERPIITEIKDSEYHKIIKRLNKTEKNLRSFL
jgi:hypothetical protein